MSEWEKNRPRREKPRAADGQGRGILPRRNPSPSCGAR